ncbi:MAG: hypothetical protein U5R48_01330 [Gammaproteobacteria bacterium]|nr:hypothetical protein [Gammaproteobacteria bacterium]
MFRRITLPLILPGIVAGGALVFLESMRELPATLLLRPTGHETLTTHLWQVYEAGLLGQAARARSAAGARSPSLALWFSCCAGERTLGLDRRVRWRAFS